MTCKPYSGLPPSCFPTPTAKKGNNRRIIGLLKVWRLARDKIKSKSQAIRFHKMRGFQAAYALPYHYSWPGAPVYGLELDLRDHGNTLRVTGPTVEQVETISAGIERELVQHSATGGYVLRSTG